jgi:DNA-binding response OmpR family regulator
VMNTVNARSRILVVWDDAAMAAATVAALVAAGYETRHAIDSLTGLVLVETWQPGLVILNWNQPLIGGPVFLYALESGLDVPPRVLILTDDGRDLPAQWPTVAGRVAKPFTARELIQVIGGLSGEAQSTDVDCA